MSDTPVGVLESVNVGLPRDLPWRGRAVRTAIDKRPVAGPVAVGATNLAGDGQADLVAHGGEHRAVFVYQQESYRYWEAQLGIRLERPGRFGENFTITRFDDAQARIGDRLRIGSAIFEITQPRVTCFKVGIALDEPRMPALLTSHGRPGFYLRVIEQGTVTAGDPIEIVSRVGGALTVRQTSDLLRLRSRPRAARAVIATPALSAGWRTSFAELLRAADTGAGNVGLTAPVAPPAWLGFRDFVVDRTVEETPTLRSPDLRPADGDALPAHDPGQFVSIRLPGARDAPAPVRSYSLSAPADGRALRISVRREGQVSTLLHRLHRGSPVEVGAPRGTFTLSQDDDAPLLLVSAGIGVTPVIAMLSSLVQARSERALSWFHVSRSTEEHAFAHDAEALLAQHPNSRARIDYTAADGTRLPPGTFAGRPAGRVSKKCA